jgi:hypothetical protein
MNVAVAISCIECNWSEEDNDFYENHQWLPDRLWCINKDIKEDLK